MAWHAKELCNPYTHDSFPVIATSRQMLAVDLWLAVAVAGAFVFVTLMSVLDAALRLIRQSFATSQLHWMILAMLPISMSLVVVRLILPIEDPYTGEGSPAAVMLGVTVYSVVGVLFAMPGLFLLASRYKSREVARQG